MTYSGDPSSSDSDYVRFLIGDTDNTNLLFTDAEISAMLTQFTSNREKTAVFLLRRLATKYARKIDYAIGDLKVQYSKLAVQYNEQADQLEEDNRRTKVQLYAGGITHSDKEVDRQDDDRVDPRFRRDQFSHEGQHRDDDKEWP